MSVNTPGVQNGRAFTDEQVLFMRREAHKAKSTQLKRWVDLYKRGPTAVANAISGNTYKHLGEAFKPIGPRVQASEAKVLFELRLEDPAGWSLKALAAYANQTWGTSLAATNISRILHRYHGYVPERPAGAKPLQAARPAAKTTKPRSTILPYESGRMLPREEEDWPMIEAEEDEAPIRRAPRMQRLIDLSDPDARRHVAQRLIEMREGAAYG